MTLYSFCSGNIRTAKALHSINLAGSKYSGEIKICSEHSSLATASRHIGGGEGTQETPADSQEGDNNSTVLAHHTIMIIL